MLTTAASRISGSSALTCSAVLALRDFPPLGDRAGTYEGDGDRGDDDGPPRAGVM
jgi:hypothetical protein